jgi:hypothetical protein
VLDIIVREEVIGEDEAEYEDEEGDAEDADPVKTIQSIVVIVLDSFEQSSTSTVLLLAFTLHNSGTGLLGSLGGGRSSGDGR